MKRVALIGIILFGQLLCFAKTPSKKQQYEFLNWYVLNNAEKIIDLAKVLERFDNFAFDRSILENFELHDEKYKGKISAADSRFLRKQISENDSVENLDVTLIRYIGWKSNIKPKPYLISSIKITTGIGQSNLDSKTLVTLAQPLKTDILFQKSKLQLPATTISLPIFTKNGKVAFINRTYNCQGLCASGGIEVYRKIKGEWKFYGYLSQWES